MSKHALVGLAAFAGLLPAGSAQSSATLRTATDVVAETSVALNVVRNTIPANTTITAPRTVNSSQNGAAASADIVPRGMFGMDLSADVSASNGFLFANSGSLTGAVDWTIAGASRGWLIVEIGAQVSIFTNATAQVQVTAPGVNEFHWLLSGSPSVARRIRHFVAFSNRLAATATVQLTASTTIMRSTSASADVRIDFVPALPPVSQTAYGATCGAELTVADATTPSSHNVTLDVADAFPSAPVVYLFGGRRANVPIQGTPCSLLTEPIAAVVVGADGNGRATLPFALPGPLQSATFDLQAVAFDATFRARASAGVELQFVD